MSLGCGCGAGWSRVGAQRPIESNHASWCADYTTDLEEALTQARRDAEFADVAATNNARAAGHAQGLIARVVLLHSHDAVTAWCSTCGRPGPCKTTRILTEETS